MTPFLHSCSVEEGARVRARIRSFDDDYEHDFIEHDLDFVTMSSKKRTSKPSAYGLNELPKITHRSAGRNITTKKTKAAK